jgi:hypothetical protein
MEIASLDNIDNIVQQLEGIISKNEGVDRIEALFESDTNRQLIIDTALFYAVQYGKEQLVLVLLEKGANPTKLQRKGRRGLTSPLHTVFTSTHAPPRLSIVELLLKHGVCAAIMHLQQISPLNATFRFDFILFDVLNVFRQILIYRMRMGTGLSALRHFEDLMHSSLHSSNASAPILIAKTRKEILCCIWRYRDQRRRRKIALP